MIEFEEEFNNCLHFGFIPNEPQNKIIEHFKDWQPPKPLVVVPQIVARYIETEEDNDYNRVGTLVYGHYKAIDGYEEYSELDEWIADNFDTFLEAIVNGYTVEKEKMYTLKHIDMSKLYTDVSLYLAHGFCKELDHVFYKDVNVHNADECHFTQSEIDKLNIGSYEQIGVDE